MDDLIGTYDALTQELCTEYFIEALSYTVGSQQHTSRQKKLYPIRGERQVLEFKILQSTATQDIFS